MEDYAAACASRVSDVDTLLSAPDRRTTAAAHLGGIAVECQVKALILTYHGLTAWGELSRRPNGPREPILRPGHSLIAGIKLMNVVYRKAKADHVFLTHLDRVMHPKGATDADFIGLRYSAEERSETAMREWRRSFDYVLGWLRKNEGKLS